VEAQLFDFCFLPLKIIYTKSKKQCAVWVGKNHTKSMTEKNGGNTTGCCFFSSTSRAVRGMGG